MIEVAKPKTTDAHNTDTIWKFWPPEENIIFELQSINFNAEMGCFKIVAFTKSSFHHMSVEGQIKISQVVWILMLMEKFISNIIEKTEFLSNKTTL